MSGPIQSDEEREIETMMRALELGLPIETDPAIKRWAIGLYDALRPRRGRWYGVHATHEDGTEETILTTYDPEAAR